MLPSQLCLSVGLYTALLYAVSTFVVKVMGQGQMS